jgi:hypothetical protein
VEIGIMFTSVYLTLAAKILNAEPNISSAM